MRVPVLRLWLLLGATGACGRIGFSEDMRQLPAVDAAPGCPATFTEAGTSCYLYRPATANWLEAEQFCETFPGAHLAVVDDAQEAATIAALGITEVIWIGISDRIVEGDYRTVTGQPAYLVWEPAFPTAAPDCVEIVASRGELKTLDCANTNQLLCEWDGRAVVAGTF